MFFFPKEKYIKEILWCQRSVFFVPSFFFGASSKLRLILLRRHENDYSDNKNELRTTSRLRSLEQLFAFKIQNKFKSIIFKKDLRKVRLLTHTKQLGEYYRTISERTV